MRLVRFDGDGGSRTGLFLGDEVVDLHLALASLAEVAAPGDMAGLLAGGDCVMDDLFTLKLQAPSKASFHADSVHLLAPITNPPKIICCWANYPHPTAPRLTEIPLFFSKYATAIIGPGEYIRLPAKASDIVVEAELTAVLGKGGRDIPVSEALSHVAGYTIVNDVTAFSHRLQALIGSRGPYMMAKTFDTFAPTGPFIVTRDEVPDPHALAVRQWLNGSLETSSTTADAVVKLPEMISYLSEFFTLQPGDLITIGSPPPLGKVKFLSPGDLVRIEIEGLGVLENPVAGAVSVP